MADATTRAQETNELTMVERLRFAAAGSVGDPGFLGGSGLILVRDLLREAAAELERVTRERDEADEAHQHLAADHYFARAEKAESELAAAREDVTQLREAAKAVDANVKGPLVGRAWVAVSGNDFARLRAVLAGLSPVPPKDTP